MGALLAAIFVFVVIALGIGAIKESMDRAWERLFGRRSAPPPATINGRRVEADPIVINAPKTDVPELDVLVQALVNEGYYGRVRLADTELTYVDNEVLSRMVEKLDRKYDIEWLLPQVRLRLRRAVGKPWEKYADRGNWLLLTPTHAFSFHREEDDEDHNPDHDRQG